MNGRRLYVQEEILVMYRLKIFINNLHMKGLSCDWQPFESHYLLRSSWQRSRRGRVGLNMKRDPWLVGDFNEKCLEYEINCGCYIIDSNVTNGSGF